MTNMLKQSLGALALAGALLTQVPGSARAEETAICYNCPPEWADWAAQIKAIKDATGTAIRQEIPTSNTKLRVIVGQIVPAVQVFQQLSELWMDEPFVCDLGQGSQLASAEFRAFWRQIGLLVPLKYRGGKFYVSNFLHSSRIFAVEVLGGLC